MPPRKIDLIYTPPIQWRSVIEELRNTEAAAESYERDSSSDLI